MSFLEKIVENKLDEAKKLILARLEELTADKITQYKKYVSESQYEEYDEISEANIVKMGRIKKIRRRVRRNAKGQIVVQRNVRRSAIKGYRISGNTVKRIPVAQKIAKARKLKRYWKTKGRAKMTRTLLKRKMSIRRRKSMGIK